METVAGMPGDGDVDPPLVDVSGMPLDQLVSSGDSVLARLLLRVVADLEQHEVLSAFANYAE
jgi:hypothetical protein